MTPPEALTFQKIFAVYPTTMVPFPLTALAEELISVVASQVQRPCDLFNFALASKQLNRIATAQLYRHVTLRIGVDDEDYKILHDLVILAFGKPEIAAYIQHLTIREKGTQRKRHKRHRINEVHSTLQLAIQSLLSDDDKRGWANKSTGWDQENTLVNILVHLLPNLLILDTNLPDLPYSHYKWLTRSVSGTPVRALAKLRSLMLVFSDNPTADRLLHFMPFFLPPCLKRVCLVGIGPGSPPRSSDLIDDIVHEDTMTLSYVIENRGRTFLSALDFYESKTIMSSVEHLEIKNAFFDYLSVCIIIGSCRALKSFAYEISGHVQHLDTAIVTALAKMHASTLERLYLGESYYSPRLLESDVPDFRQLTNLQHLKIAVMPLFAFCPESESPFVFTPRQFCAS